MEKKYCKACDELKTPEEFHSQGTNICRKCMWARQNRPLGIDNSMLTEVEKDSARVLLRALGYELNSDRTIHQQFLERHPELKK